MDVFLRNLPADLTDQGLKGQLIRFTKALNIYDWSCQKPRSKSFGFITFLHPQDGEKFLRHHGQNRSLGKSKSGMGLEILGTKIYCKCSNRDPDQYLLKSLTKSAEDRYQENQESKQVQDDAKVVFRLQSLSCGYYEYANGKLIYSPESRWETNGGQAKFAKRMLIIEFENSGGKKRVEIPYRIVEAMAVSTQHRTFTITLWEVPKFFDVVNPVIIEMMASLSLHHQKTLTPRSRLTGLSDGTSRHLAIGQSLVYQISLSPDGFDEMTRKLYERNVLPIYRHNVPTPPLHKRRSLADGLKQLSKSIQDCSDGSNIIPFGVLYQMEALVRNGYLLPWTVQGVLNNMVRFSKDIKASSKPKDFPISPSAVRKLFSQIPFPGLDVDASVFETDEIWECIQQNEKVLQHEFAQGLLTRKDQPNIAMVRRVNVTPTGITLHGPDPEANNRILRRFCDHSEFFIRVLFCDEDGTTLRFNSDVSNAGIYQRFKQIFQDGIPIGGRVFKFLGFSHSSLRNHSAWFMAPFFHGGEMQTYFSVISGLGKFDNIYSPARCAARIGQAFSETPLAVSLSEHRIEHTVIPDIVSKTGDRVFSDGVGSLSHSVMEKIHKILPQRKSGPTCFQIRWGAAKGMLALDSRLEGNILCVRKSMIKFESLDRENLEICDMATKPIPMKLNRQLIKILEDKGVSMKWFFLQQDQALRTLQDITANVTNTVNYLKRKGIAHRVGFPQFISRLDMEGIDYRSDRFLSAVVEASVLRELRLLKYKARIPVKQGVTLFGIMDETGYLEEGEVYVAFDDADFVRGRSVDLDNRQMIITRSPALHPGDIQIAVNILPLDHHPLRALRNCIVFSQKGERDLPSCLSGGDLDGDIYSIIWDQDAVRQCQHVFEPADYPRVEPLNIQRPVKREDMTDFFIQFMETNQLGLIAVKHMILADQKDAGTADPDCKRLAEMHSTGVDYSKTGRPVDMSQLKNIKTNKYRPDFLAPTPPTSIKDRTEISFDVSSNPSPDEIVDEDDSNGPTYQYYFSDKINGRLYRAVDEEKIWHENIRISVDSAVDIWEELVKYIDLECNEILGKVHWSEKEKEAWEILSIYEDAIWNATLAYSDHAAIRITELEVFTGAIFNKSGVQTQRQRDKSLRLKDEFDRITQWTETMIRKPEMGGQSSSTDEDRIIAGSDDGLALSMACLHVGLKRKQSRRFEAGRFDGKFQSFKVIAACCVIRELDAAMKRGKRGPDGASKKGTYFSRG